MATPADLKSMNHSIKFVIYIIITTQEYIVAFSVQVLLQDYFLCKRCLTWIMLYNGGKRKIVMCRLTVAIRYTEVLLPLSIISKLNAYLRHNRVTHSISTWTVGQNM